jgi:hypothetical protein
MEGRTVSAGVAEIVREVADAGGRLAVAGDRIRVSAPRPLPDRLVDALRRRKGEVIAYLGRGGDAWGTDEWRQWIAERAAILEHDGGLSRPEADGQAFQHAIVERLNRHPAMTDPHVCAGCDEPINEGGTDWRPLADGATVHYGGAYGLRCWERHGAKRRAEAEAALAGLGVKP